MSEIRIERTHQLGLARAREMAVRWQDQAMEKYGMRCRYEAGEEQDCLHMERSGASGELVISAKHLSVRLELGFLMSAYAGMIESQMQKNLDELLGTA